MLIISRKSVEERLRREREQRRQQRQQVERITGRFPQRKDAPARGDFSVTHEYDKSLKDYKRFKDKGDRKKIEAEYYGRQKEHQRKNLESGTIDQL